MDIISKPAGYFRLHVRTADTQVQNDRQRFLRNNSLGDSSTSSTSTSQLLYDTCEYNEAENNRDYLLTAPDSSNTLGMFTASMGSGPSARAFILCEGLPFTSQIIQAFSGSSG